MIEEAGDMAKNLTNGTGQIARQMAKASRVKACKAASAARHG